jgi:hypothetical protein
MHVSFPSLPLFTLYNPALQEDPKQTLYFAHLFFADHVVSTAWTVFFTLVWWLWTPHDGSRQANSPAQQAMIDAANITQHFTDEEREIAAMKIWNAEKGTAVVVIALSWLSKVLITHRSITHQHLIINPSSTLLS